MLKQNLNNSQNMITVKFSCDKCGLKDVSVEVPARTNPDPSAVVPWVQMAALMCAEEHSRRSPNCLITKFENMKIPAPPEAEFIGQQIE